MCKVNKYIIIVIIIIIKEEVVFARSHTLDPETDIDQAINKKKMSPNTDHV